MRSFIKSLVLSFAVCLLVSMPAFAVSYNVSPADFLTPGTAFTYDPDAPAPTTAAGAPTGYGTDSLYANVNQSGPAADHYRTLRILVPQLFNKTVALSDIASISYMTNKPVGQDKLDWRMAIYTFPTADTANNGAGWYRSRLQARPDQATNLNAPANQWNQWTTGGSANQLSFYEDTSKRSLNSMTWAGITGGTTTWDYSDENIKYIDLALGTGSSSPASWWTGESRLDGVIITLKDGTTANINLGTVPEPLTMIALFGGITAVGGYIRRRAKA